MRRKIASLLFILGICLSLLTGNTAQAGVVPSGISDSYRSGSYYGKLTSVLWGQPNAQQKDRLVAIAMSQKGYNSSANKSDFTGDGPAGKTSSDLTYCEYSRWCGANGKDWCASFVSWCAYMAGIPTSIIPKSAGAGTYRSCGTQHKIWSNDFQTYIDYQPKKGDLMLAMPRNSDKKGHRNGWDKTAHVAIVAEDATSRASDGGWTFTTIERRGTTVGQRTMSTKIRAGGTSASGTHYVQMFVTPNYKANDRTPPTNCSLSIYSSDYKPGSPVTLTPSGNNVSYYLLTVRDAANTGTIYFSKSDFTGPVTYTPDHNGTYAVWVNALSPNGGMAKFYDSFTIQDHAHSWGTGAVTLTPTCSRTGVRTYTCSICGETKTETIAMLTTHVWGTGVVTKSPTCTAEGVRTYTCVNNSSHTRTEAIPKTGHKAGTAVKENIKSATCAAAGSYDEVTYCTVCGAQISRRTVTTSKTAHTWDGGKVTKAATATSTGVRTYTCKVCNATKTEDTPKLKAENQPLPVDQAPSVKTEEKKILSMSGDEAPKNARFSLLQLHSGNVGEHSIQLRWKKVKGASGYIIYGAKCGQKNKKLKVLDSGSRVSWTQKNLKPGKYYKYFIAATAKKGSETRVIATSVMIHVITKGGATGNYKSVKLLKYKNKGVVLKKGKEANLSAKAVAGSKKVKSHRALRFESTNKAIATVGAKNGKVKARKKGTCYIYIYAHNGVFQWVKVKVKG